MRDARSACLAAALLAAAVMADEVALMRALSFAQWYHFGFLVVSAAMLAAASAGIWRALRPSTGALPTTPALLAAIAFAAQPLSLKAIPLEITALLDHPAQALWLVALVLLLAAPLFFIGLAMTDLLSSRELPTRLIYAADLAGASAGGLLALLLLPLVGSTGIPLLAGAGAAVGAAVLVDSRRLAAAAAVLVVALASLSAFAHTLLVPHVTSSKVIGNQPAHDVLARRDLVLFEGEDSVARVHVLKTAEGPRILFDAGTAVTRVPALGSTWSLPAPIDDELAAPFRHASGGSVLVIGSGGGWEVVRALSHGAVRVVAVEVSSVVVNYVQHHAPAAVRQMFADGRVELVLDEARSFLERSDERFDAILMVHTISNAAAASGALALAEDPLLTVEAMQTLSRHLSDRGMLFVTRPDAQLIGLARLVATALPDASPDRLLLWSSPRHGGFLSALVFVRGTAALPALPTFAQVRTAPPAFDGPVATDDRPFFHALARGRAPLPSLDDIAAVLRGGRDNARGDDPSRAARMALEELPASLVVTWLTALLSLLALAAMAILSRRARNPFAPVDALGAVGLGVAFMLVELASVSRLTVLLGAPGIAFTVVAGALLLGAGAGSAASSRLWPDGLSLARSCAIAAAGAVWCALLVPLAAEILEPAAPLPRGLAAVGCVLPAGAAMGLPFPSLIKQASARGGTISVAWCWAFNGAASVLGGALAVVIPLYAGLQLTLLAAAIVYLSTSLAARRSIRNA